MDIAKSQESGFTLIEIVVSLVLVGIMAVVAGMGIVSFAKGYVLAKENTHTAQKAQLAMGRLSREMMELLDITAASAAAISFESKSGNRKVGLDGATIKIAESATALADGDVLIDKVDSFNLTYYQDYPGTSWEQGTDDLDLLTAIRIEFQLSGVGSTFSTMVFPRNK